MPTPEQVRILRVTPTVISVLDYSQGFGHTARWPRRPGEPDRARAGCGRIAPHSSSPPSACSACVPSAHFNANKHGGHSCRGPIAFGRLFRRSSYCPGLSPVPVFWDDALFTRGRVWRLKSRLLQRSHRPPGGSRPSHWRLMCPASGIGDVSGRTGVDSLVCQPRDLLPLDFDPRHESLLTPDEDHERLLQG